MSKHSKGCIIFSPLYDVVTNLETKVKSLKCSDNAITKIWSYLKINQKWINLIKWGLNVACLNMKKIHKIPNKTPRYAGTETRELNDSPSLIHSQCQGVY